MKSEAFLAYQLQNTRHAGSMPAAMPMLTERIVPAPSEGNINRNITFIERNILLPRSQQVADAMFGKGKGLAGKVINSLGVSYD